MSNLKKRPSRASSYALLEAFRRYVNEGDCPLKCGRVVFLKNFKQWGKKTSDSKFETWGNLLSSAESLNRFVEDLDPEEQRQFRDTFMIPPKAKRPSSVTQERLDTANSRIEALEKQVCELEKLQNERHAGATSVLKGTFVTIEELGAFAHTLDAVSQESQKTKEGLQSVKETLRSNGVLMKALEMHRREAAGLPKEFGT